jgi:hypothetical protein
VGLVAVLLVVMTMGVVVGSGGSRALVLVLWRGRAPAGAGEVVGAWRKAPQQEAGGGVSINRSIDSILLD